MHKKKILYLTGTRADFGKLKSLIKITNDDKAFDVKIFATGMHMHKKYGYTVLEIEKSGFKNIYKYINSTSESTMDLTLAKTIEGLSSFIQEDRPELIVIHGDRVEALAGAIVGALNNILVAHIEGGEVSGTIDELIRHSVSKLSHSHFVSNEEAKTRLIQMGERNESIFTIGSPDIDLMFSPNLPTLEEVKRYYEIQFQNYGIVMFHPVTTEADKIAEYAKNMVDAILQSKLEFVVIFPNNDMGSGAILQAYEELKNNTRFKIFPSIRFESFLTLLRNAKMIVGNSSAGIREAPYYGVASVNIGTRQSNRALNPEIINCGYSKTSISEAIEKAKKVNISTIDETFGHGNSAQLFLETLHSSKFWEISKQKRFNDILIPHQI